MAGSLVDFGGFDLNPAWTVALPFGAVAYGMFLISFMLEKESAKFDEDKAKELQLIHGHFIILGPKGTPGTQPALMQLPSQMFGHWH